MEKIWLKSYDPGVAHSMNYPEHTLQQLLEESVSRYADCTAIIFPGAFGDESMMSYRELDRQCNKLANALLEMGVKKGDRVALLMPNCPQFVISYYAVLKVGAIVVA
ncbi:MAG: AMP-binding protein, partial [Dehalococcoidia bacterium]|nr:AMP-binding protein [Dehalococcoidia bacterium]